MSDEDLIIESVVSTAENLEEMEDPDELELMDVKYMVSSHGHVTEVYGVYTVGGPYIEIRMLSCTVFGSWGSDQHTTHFNNDVIKGYGEHLADMFEYNIDV